MTVWSVSRRAHGLLGLAVLVAAASLSGDALVRAQAPVTFTVTATKGDYTVKGSDKKEIRVNAGDLVRITFDAEDIPHSFTTVETSAHYRIDRRAEPGKPVTFEFRADRAGIVAIICKLTLDPECKDMKLDLVVVQK